MTQLPVSWNEGMFLRPHHFQASDRYWGHQLRESIGWTTPYSYGIRSIEFGRDAISNAQFELTSIQLRFQDGTLLELGQELGRLDLKPVFATADHATVCLAVPRLRDRLRNVGVSDASNHYRFREVTLDQSDENDGGNDQAISYRQLQVRLCLSTETLDGYEILPIAGIRRAGGKDGTPQLDNTYAPALLNVQCWPDLSRDVIRATHDIIGQKITVVSQQIKDRGITLGSGDTGDLERVFMLQALNESDASLGAMLVARELHPFPLYVEMCRIVGILSIFGQDRRVPELPRYDHDHLMPVFTQLRDQVRVLLGTVSRYEYEQRYFTGAGQGMAVALENKWLGEDWQWFVGVRASPSNARVADLLQPGRLDWKIGSANQVDFLFRNKFPGLGLQPVSQHPRALPPDGDWLYFQVSKQGPAWQSVLEDRTLGMRFKRELIVNKDQLEGQRQLAVAASNETILLEIALFAVPKNSGVQEKR
ncbi:MAG TPA: type VI secretion system baseplate subunit TssK [Planctomicrobium sp.]|nr:type VI secretion system baseplate subunit TssK [Planctomicrobium sp.]